MIKTGERSFSFFVLSFFCLLLISTTACSVKKVHVYEDAETQKKGEPPRLSYSKIILQSFDADENVLQTDPDAPALCENASLRELMDQGSALMIIKASSKIQRQKDALIVKVRLAFTGGTVKARATTPSPRSRLAAHVRLIDASDGKTLAEENIFATARHGKRLSENPADLGAAVARYIDKFIRSK